MGWSGQGRGSEPGPVAPEILLDSLAKAGPGNLPGPQFQYLPAQRGQSHPFGEPLAIHLPAKHPKAN